MFKLIAQHNKTENNNKYLVASKIEIINSTSQNTMHSKHTHTQTREQFYDTPEMNN